MGHKIYFCSLSNLLLNIIESKYFATLAQKRKHFRGDDQFILFFNIKSLAYIPLAADVHFLLFFFFNTIGYILSNDEMCIKSLCFETADSSV